MEPLKKRLCNRQYAACMRQSMSSDKDKRCNISFCNTVQHHMQKSINTSSNHNYTTLFCAVLIRISGIHVDLRSYNSSHAFIRDSAYDMRCRGPGIRHVPGKFQSRVSKVIQKEAIHTIVSSSLSR